MRPRGASYSASVRCFTVTFSDEAQSARVGEGVGDDIVLAVGHKPVI